MIKLKEEKGITLITLAVAIIIMFIISSILIYNSSTNIKTRLLNNMYSDIENLKQKVNVYYSSYGTIPILSSKYTNVANSIKTTNPNDNGNYYVINLEVLDNLTLNYGQDYKRYKENPNVGGNDLYIINEQSHEIYYAKGVTLDNKTYYSIPASYTKIETTANISNHPKLANGMTPLKWNGNEFEETKSYDPDWYNYAGSSATRQVSNINWENSQTEAGSMKVWIPKLAYKVNDDTNQVSNINWANAKTEDGSMWVWIPRFAYKINYIDENNKSSGGTIDIVFLKGTTNLDFQRK